jgi:hypothetical protein
VTKSFETSTTFPAWSAGNIFFDSGNLALEYGNVAHVVDVIGRIDNVAAF